MGHSREGRKISTDPPSSQELAAFLPGRIAVSDVAAHIPVALCSTETYSNAYLSSSIHLRISDTSHTYQLIRDMAPISG